jgi:hypothetical protein
MQGELFPMSPTETMKKVFHLLEEQSFLLKKMHEANQKFFLNAQELLKAQMEKGNES